MNIQSQSLFTVEEELESQIVVQEDNDEGVVNAYEADNDEVYFIKGYN